MRKNYSIEKIKIEIINYILDHFSDELQQNNIEDLLDSLLDIYMNNFPQIRLYTNFPELGKLFTYHGGSKLSTADTLPLSAIIVILAEVLSSDPKEYEQYFIYYAGTKLSASQLAAITYNDESLHKIFIQEDPAYNKK